MMARAWYSFYPADYVKDTGHLSLIEHGAYRVLMDHYYATAEPLPGDVTRLKHLCRARTRAEKRAVRFVLGEFFAPDTDGFRHPRIEAEIAKAEEITARLSANGRLGAARRHGPGRSPASGAATARPKPSQSQSPSQLSPATEAALRALWAGRAAPLVEAVGAAAFQAYFAGADFQPGPPVTLIVAKPHLRALIARKFSGALKRVYGEFQLEGEI
jgi:uncharacterized protein YdaU (DUF1376 family)